MGRSRARHLTLLEERLRAGIYDKLVLASCIEDAVSSGTARSYEASGDILRRVCVCRHSRTLEEEQGIYRGEVTDIIGALADIKMAILRILNYIEDDDEEEEAEEDRPPDP